MSEKPTTPEPQYAEKWLTYRPEIKVLDCTIRDGGLMNDHGFEDALVQAVYRACIEGGIDYMEIGYKTSSRIAARNRYGAWKFCREEDLRRIAEDHDDNTLKLSVMADAERTDYHTDILPSDESVVDMVRIATYIHQLATALDMIKDAHDKGYETSLNLMAVSTVPERELDEALEILAASEVEVIYLVDSFGSLYSEQIQYLTRKYLHWIGDTGKQVGVHTHNNQQLAFANTIEAIIMGANLLDASLAGCGRGAGNCPMELLIGFLHNPKFRLRPLLECIQAHIEPLRASLRWGFDIPYAITGLLNQHPRAAIEYNSRTGDRSIVDFFDSTIEEE